MPDFDMGAYGAYVWPAWGLSLATLLLLTVRSAVLSRRTKRALDELEGGER